MSYEKEITKKLLELKPDCYSSSIFGHDMPLADSEYVLIEKLKYIPQDNKERIFNDMTTIVTDRVKNVDTFVQALAGQGYLKFEPYMTKNSVGTPTLVLKHNRFVHLFRGYYFQVSYTAEGIGEYRKANVRLDHTLSLIKDIEMVFDDRSTKQPDYGECETELKQAMERNRIQEIFCYMNCINACTGIDAFDVLLQKSPDIVDAFVKESVKHRIPDFSLTYREMIDLLCTNSTDMISIQDPKAIYRLPASDTQDVCRLRVYDWDTVAVETMRGCSYHECIFKFPPFELSSEFSKKYGDAFWRFDFPQRLQESLFLQLVSFVLNSVSVIINYMVVYSNRKDTNNNLLALNNPEVKTLSTLNDLTGLYN